MDSEETVKHGGFEEEFHLLLLLLLLLSRQPSGDQSDIRRQLVMAKELGVPVSRVNLINS